jgi:hypothetical protein
MTIPGSHRVAVIFDVVKLAAIPDRPFRKVRIAVEYLDAGVSQRNRRDARGNQQKETVSYCVTTLDE